MFSTGLGSEVIIDRSALTMSQRIFFHHQRARHFDFQVFHRARQVERTRDRHLLEGLEISLCGEILTFRGIHRRRSSRHGATVGAAGPPVRRNKIPESYDITQTQIATPT